MSRNAGIKIGLKQILIAVVAIVLKVLSFSAEATPSASYFIYDESGHVIGEYDANGNPVEEHIYLGDKPVAVVQGQGGSVGYVTTDQLNTPRAVTNASQTIEWSWTSDPFGNSQPTGSLTYNLRFPGQYYDAETGHNYNYNRDYDPGTGRYMESDPIGLRGGANTYGYTMENPINAADPLGLLSWTDDATQMITGYPSSGMVERYPGDGSTPIPPSSAFTVGTWDIQSACQCDGSGGYKFTGFTVHFHAVIYFKSDYSFSNKLYDWVMRNEFQHVSDINEWTQRARNLAQSLEDQLKGGSYSSMEECEQATKAALNAALGASFNNELGQTSANWDYPGGPHSTPPN